MFDVEVQTYITVPGSPPLLIPCAPKVTELVPPTAVVLENVASVTDETSVSNVLVAPIVVPVEFVAYAIYAYFVSDVKPVKSVLNGVATAPKTTCVPRV